MCVLQFLIIYFRFETSLPKIDSPAAHKASQICNAVPNLLGIGPKQVENSEIHTKKWTMCFSQKRPNIFKILKFSINKSHWCAGFCWYPFWLSWRNCAQPSDQTLNFPMQCLIRRQAIIFWLGFSLEARMWKCKRHPQASTCVCAAL